MQRLYLTRDYCGVLRYDPNTGLFRWLVTRNCRAGRVRPGDIAGTLKDGYVQIIVTVNGKRQSWRAHRLAWLLMTGELIKEVGHNEGQRDDNRWDHLSDVTRSQNMLNPTNAPRSDNRSGKTGVSWRADTEQVARPHHHRRPHHATRRLRRVRRCGSCTRTRGGGAMKACIDTAGSI